MCHLYKHHNALIDAMFSAFGETAAERRDIPVSLASIMLCEATKAERGRTPEDMPSTIVASGLIKSVTPEQRNEALHFLSKLKHIVKMAGNTLALAKHTCGDKDAEEIAPGMGPLAEKVKAMEATADPLAQMFSNPLGGKRPDNPRWN